MHKLICIACPKGCHLQVDEANDYAVTGNSCEKGIAYGKQELLAPARVLTTTVQITNALHKRLPVHSKEEIPKELIEKCVRALDNVCVNAPVRCGQVILPNILDTGVDIVASRDM